MTTRCIPFVEADDVIATVAFKWLALKRGPVSVLSTDKDMAWLMAFGARIRDHFASEWRDEAWCFEKFHVPSSLVLDSLALTGDKSDDVPGIDKVGPKTAGKWLMDFGCLEEVLANAHTLTGKVADNLKNNLDVPVLSRQLVTLKTDVPLNLTWKELRIAPRP